MPQKVSTTRTRANQEWTGTCPSASCRCSTSNDLKPMLNPFSRVPGCESRMRAGSHHQSVLNHPGGARARTHTPGRAEPLPGRRNHVGPQNPQRNGLLPSRHVMIPGDPKLASHLYRVPWKRVKNCSYYASEEALIMVLASTYVVSSWPMFLPFIDAESIRRNLGSW